MLQKYSCIIASYNERPRISKVLKVVVTLKKVSEVICVDDGSTDGTAELIKSKFKTVKLIRFDTNRGKTSAIEVGIRASVNENLLLLDADLVGLKAKEIETALNTFEMKNLDCLIMLTQPDKYNKFIRKIFKGTRYVAGDRVIGKKILTKVLEDKPLRNYDLEISENKYLLRNKSKVAMFQLSAVDLGKISKYGFAWGIIREVKMWTDIFLTSGVSFFSKQRKFFEAIKILNV